MDPALPKQAAAEIVGTFFLTLAALASGTPFAVALTLAALVYAIGDISGCNINPAVTVGLVALRRLPLTTGLYYIIAQAFGAIIAFLALSLTHNLPVVAYTQATAPFEFLGVGFLVFVVAALSQGFVPKAGSGIAIGSALGAGLLTSKGILNPAVAVAMSLANHALLWQSIVATLVGGVVFALLFQLIAVGGKSDATGPEGDKDKSKDKS